MQKENKRGFRCRYGTYLQLIGAVTRSVVCAVHSIGTHTLVRIALSCPPSSHSLVNKRHFVLALIQQASSVKGVPMASSTPDLCTYSGKTRQGKETGQGKIGMYDAFLIFHLVINQSIVQPPSSSLHLSLQL